MAFRLRSRGSATLLARQGKERGAHPTRTEVEQMKRIDSFSWRLVAGGALVATLGSAMPAAAQTVSGQARAIQTSIVDSLGGITTTMLGDTGTLGGATDWREASAPGGAVSSIISGNTLHATTIGWTDQVDSEASVSDLAIKVG